MCALLRAMTALCFTQWCGMCADNTALLQGYPSSNQQQYQWKCNQSKCQ